RELVPGEVKDPALRQKVAEAGATAAGAYEDFAAFLESNRARAGGDYAIGEDLYTALLREKELLPLDARELRERGREQYDLLASRRGTAEPSPHYQRPIQAVASYNQPPAFSDSLHGHFFVPYPPDGTPPEEVQKRLEGNCSAGIPTTAVHEAYPGHHWHLVMAHFTPSRLRQVFNTPYFSDGWALYAERVMREQGFFADPKHVLYRYEATISRAARIIVDVSLHL